MMTDHPAHWSEAQARALALAARLEGEGQYNVAKLLRAAADSLARRQAFARPAPTDLAGLGGAVAEAAEGLARLEVEAGLIEALRRGAEALGAGRLTMIDETPDPFVCRTCGHLALAAPPEKCPACGAWAATFQRFPPVYWLEAFNPSAVVGHLRETPRLVAGLIAGLQEASMARVPPGGGWSVRAALAHLRDAQRVLAGRLSLLLERDNPPLESLAVFDWAQREAAGAREIFEAYRSSRGETVGRLEGLSLSDWWRAGQHAEFGPVTIAQQASYFAAHELTHLAQIEALCRQRG